MVTPSLLMIQMEFIHGKQQIFKIVTGTSENANHIKQGSYRQKVTLGALYLKLVDARNSG